jgi:xanthine/CO dehydrogenase XdhC/CoxF family maturation factor
MMAELDAASDLRVHAPRGLDRGAETPTDVALAIATEIRSLLTGGRGGRLGDGTGVVQERRSYPAVERIRTTG